jgi:hypothetical protein
MRRERNNNFFLKKGHGEPAAKDLLQKNVFNNKKIISRDLMHYYGQCNFLTNIYIYIHTSHGLYFLKNTLNNYYRLKQFFQVLSR